MSTFEVLSRGTIIGETDLEHHDEGMNVRLGRFHPGPEYARVRSIFKMYSVALDLNGAARDTAVANYYRSRDALELTVRKRGGEELPSGAVHINDLDDSLDDLAVEVYPPARQTPSSEAQATDDLNEFEQAVLAKLLAGEHAVLAVLRAQAQAASVVSREYTGVGFFLSFETPHDAPSLTLDEFNFGDVNAVVEGLRHGVGFVLFVRGGRLHTLEGYSYDEPWPKEIRGFSLSYQCEPRELALPDVK